MKDILLSTERKFSATVVPNIFIDRYMPEANGSYIKVYLYLLRCMSGTPWGFTIANAAETLDETEKDIIRALKYWQKKGVLVLSENGSEIDGITLLELNGNPEGSALTAVHATAAEARISIAPEEPKEHHPAPHAFSSQDIQRLMTDNIFSETLEAVGSLLGRMITKADTDLIMFLYNDLHFSEDLIIYLYETCLDRKKKSNKYIQQVAINWYEQGIDSPEAAALQSSFYDATISIINKSWSLSRPLGDAEMKIVNTWKSMGFAPEMIKEACDRTLMNCHTPSFQYADKILSGWKAKSILTPADLSRDDKPAARTATRASVTKSAENYNRYQKHSYSDDDMLQLEKMLLGQNSSEIN